MKFIYSSPLFLDTLHSLMHELRGDSSNSLCILGAIDFCKNHDYHEFVRGYDKVIVFNQEPLEVSRNNNLAPGTRWVFPDSEYYSWLKQADEVWDYDYRNIEILAEMGIPAKLHVLQPYMDWNQYAPVKKDIDILFIGVTHWQRRSTVLDFLKKKNNVVILDNTYGDLTTDYILRSRILLNIHGTATCQEQARMVKWLGAPCEIVSEKSNYNYLNVPEKEYWELFLL